MNATTFTPDPLGTGSYAHATCAALHSGAALHVRGSRRLDEVELSRCGVSDYLMFRVTAAEARALGAELLAAAAAVESQLGGKAVQS